MRRDTFKLLIFAGIVGFAILYGMELSSKGIESVNGPWETVSPGNGTVANDNDWTLPVQNRNQNEQNANPVKSPYYQSEEEKVAIPRNDREPIVDRVSGKTAEVLHDLSRNGIRMVVSIFDRVLG
ncbi:hypothetical protein [Cohnella mopanensis]|uniref:hypothetical protein n=1 Tax=Cohnella mopanensis TaxID=2911966 RepID=UPI001EF9B383|nr:hypothetical protein [Cohnella mopanensis]